MTEADTTVEYRDVEGFPGYRVGSDGSVWSCRPKDGRGPLSATWRRRRPGKLKNGHLHVTLMKDKRPVHVLLHRLVLTTFVGPCPDGMEARHFPDRDPGNCRLSNLRWGTHRENMLDKEAQGTAQRGSRHGNAKLSESDVVAIRERAERGDRHIDIAADFGIEKSNVSIISRRVGWKHVK